MTSQNKRWITLSDTERAEVDKLSRMTSVRRDLGFRACIIKRLDEGRSYNSIAAEMHTSRNVVRLWCRRWLKTASLGMTVRDRLKDASGRGAPLTFGSEVRATIFSLACEKPENSDRPISRWTAREIADELVKRGLVQSISPRHVSRILKKADIKPHLSKGWMNRTSNDPEFDKKVKNINRLYASAKKKQNEVRESYV